MSAFTNRYRKTFQQLLLSRPPLRDIHVPVVNPLLPKMWKPYRYEHLMYIWPSGGSDNSPKWHVMSCDMFCNLILIQRLLLFCSAAKWPNFRIFNSSIGGMGTSSRGNRFYGNILLDAAIGTSFETSRDVMSIPMASISSIVVSIFCDCWMSAVIRINMSRHNFSKVNITGALQFRHFWNGRCYGFRIISKVQFVEHAYWLVNDSMNHSSVWSLNVKTIMLATWRWVLRQQVSAMARSIASTRPCDSIVASTRMHQSA